MNNVPINTDEIWLSSKRYRYQPSGLLATTHQNVDDKYVSNNHASQIICMRIKLAQQLYELSKSQLENLNSLATFLYVIIF